MDDQRVVVLTGDVYVFQGEAGTADFLEIRADAAVVWLLGAAPLEESLSELVGRCIQPALARQIGWCRHAFQGPRSRSGSPLARIGGWLGRYGRALSTSKVMSL